MTKHFYPFLNFFGKSSLAFLLCIFFASTAFADIASYVTKAQADAAVALLKTKSHIAHYCASCGDKQPRVEAIKSVVASKADEQNLWLVYVSNSHIDLAYVYYPEQSGDWRNLAFYVGLRVSSVPEFLKGQSSNPPPNPRPNQPPNQNPNAVQWLPVVEMDRQIFPSFFLAMATQPIVESKSPGVIGDAQGKIGVHIINPKANTRLRIGYEIDSIIKYQEFETTLAEAGKYYQIYPKVVWNWEALKRFKKPSPANASFSLYLDGKLIEKQTLVVRIRSINESVYAYSYLLDENRWANTGWLFAAYVNEDHEWIDQILKEALNTRTVNSFIGYQGKPDDVIQQIFAVWYVLQRRGFRYSSITETSGTGTTQKVYSQYVRLFEESINASQANCVDGSVLLASILKKIGIRVALILVPGHCLLAFDLDGKGNWRGLETTMMGNVDLARYPDEATKIKAAVEGFGQAVSVGNQTLAKSFPKINENHPQYKLVDIDQARRAGVFPISW
jgi:hypothetical protein